MTRILSNNDQVPLPSENYHISVKPFYIHFHDCLEPLLSTMEGSFRKISEKMENEENLVKMEMEISDDTRSDDEEEELEEQEDGTNNSYEREEEYQEPELDMRKCNSFSELGKTSRQGTRRGANKCSSRSTHHRGGRGRRGSNNNARDNLLRMEIEMSDNTRCEDEEVETEEQEDGTNNSYEREEEYLEPEMDMSKSKSFFEDGKISRRGARRGANMRSSRSTHHRVGRGRRGSNNNARDKAATDRDQVDIPSEDISSRSHCRGGRVSAARGRGRAMNKSRSQPHLTVEENTDFSTSSYESCKDDAGSERNVNNRYTHAMHRSFEDHMQTDFVQDDMETDNIEALTKTQPKRSRFEHQNQGSQEEAFKKYEEKEPVTQIQSTFLESCFGDFEDCKVRYDAAQQLALFEGTEESVRDRHLKLLTELKKIKEDSVELTPAMIEILSTAWHKPCLEKLNNLISTRGCKLDCEVPFLKVLAHGEDNLHSSLEILRAEISGHKLIPMQGNISETEFDDLKSMIEWKFSVIVSKQQGKLVIQGMKEEVKKATERIVDKLQNVLDVTDKFEVIGPQASYINHLMERIPLMLKDVTIDDKQVSETKVSITIRGKKPQVLEAMKKLKSMMSSIHSKSWDLQTEFNKKEDLWLITTYQAESTALHPFINHLERENHCSVLLKLPKRTEIPVKNVQQSRQNNARSNKSSGPRRPFGSKFQHQSRGATEQQERPFVYNLGSTCQLAIQAGANITQESSEVLVCVLDDKVDLRKTRVGTAFNKACPSLWKQLNKAREENGQGTSVLVTKGPFQGLPGSCQAVYHVILSKWSPGSSEAHLKQVVQTIVSHATSTRMTSISIPPLGCGRALGFPSTSVAQIMIQTLLSVVPQSSLKKVVLLAGDPTLIGDYKGEAQKVLSSVASPSVSDMKSDPGENFSGPGAEGGDNGESSGGSSSSDDEDEEEEDTNSQLQYDGPASVSIWSEKSQNLDALWSKLKSSIKAKLLHVDHFNQTDLDMWPKLFHRKVCLEAKKKPVWVEISKDPRTNMASYTAKGEKHAVEKIIQTISHEHKLYVEKMPKRIYTSKAPKRGTVDFVHHAAACSEHFPSYWKLGRKEAEQPGYFEKKWKKLKDAVLQKTESKKFFTDVNDETKKAIIKLVETDFDPNLGIGGRDAANLNRRGIKIVGVQRIENLILFEQYNMQRKRLFEDCSRRKQMCKDIGTLRGSKGRVASTEKLPNSMKRELYWEINEHYLFHGTQNVDTLAMSGPDPRVGSEAGMFGRGFYLAERPEKSDQYAGMYKYLVSFLHSFFFFQF